jgi:hypothetical protein
MKKISIVAFKCDFCDETFSNKLKCRLHEELEHKCPNCIHSYYVYGCELNCHLENNNKKCNFKKKGN